MDEITLQWLQRAKYDLETAQGMIKIRKYLYAAFMCQQTLEKLLKAFLTKQNKAPVPTHNLFRLAELANIKDLCESIDSNLLIELTPFCIKARYGDYKRRLSELCNRKQAMLYVKRTERMYQCLLKKIKSVK